MLRKLRLFWIGLGCLLSGCVPEVIPVVDLSSKEVEVATDCQSVVVDVACNVAWTASMSGGEWVRVAETRMDETGTSGTVKLRFQVNDTYDTRTDTLVVTAGKVAARCVVRQTGLASILSTSSVTIMDMEPVFFTIDSKMTWTATPTDTKAAPSWFSVSPSSAAPGLTEIKVTPKESNVNVGDRNAFVKIEMGGKHFYVTVTQKQKDALLMSADKMELTNKEGTFSVPLRTNIDYEVAVQEDCRAWLSTVSTKALNEFNPTFKVKANPEDTPRHGTIVFSGNGLADTLHVYQAERDILVLEGTGVELTCKGGPFDVNLRSNVEYGVSIVGGDGWLVMTEAGQPRVDRKSFYAAANGTAEMRSAQIVFKDVNSDLSQTYSVTQDSSKDDPFYSSRYPGVFGFGEDDWTAGGTGVQMSLIGYRSSYSYRMMWPSAGRAVEVASLPLRLTLGDSANVKVKVVESGRTTVREIRMKLVMQRDGMLWLASDGDEAIIVEAPDEL